MKIEILFRALRTDGQGWVYGDLIQYSDTEYKILEPFFRQWDILEGGYNVIPETVGQLIHVNDEGEEFYTGDIVRQYNHDSDTYNDGELVFCDLDMAWKLKDTGVSFYKYHSPTVIGNIHEQTEQ